MKLTPIHEGIAFTFLDEYSNGFNNVSDGGIIFKSYEHDTATSRWAKVLAIGPEVKYVKVGDIIYIENLRWTEGYLIEDQRVWFTIEREVMLVRDLE